MENVIAILFSVTAMSYAIYDVLNRASQYTQRKRFNINGYVD